MADDDKREIPAEFVRELAAESGITEAQIRDIISMVGPDKGSILREAREIARAK